MPAFLILSDGKQIPVEDGLVLGRDPKAGVVLDDKKASRKHARIISQGGVVEIEDLKSSNGTRLNGKPVDKRMLRNGDVLTIGTTDIAFREALEAPPASGGGFEAGEDLFADEPADPPRQVESVEVIGMAGPRTAPEPIAENPAPPAPARPAPAPRPREPEQPAAEPARPEQKPAAFEPVVEVRTSAEPVPAADEEVLEFADEDVVLVKRTIPPAGKKAAKQAAAKPERDGGVLQFHRVDDRKGLAAQDLSQMSGLMRLALVLVALAVAGGLFYFAMQLAD